MGNIFVCYSSKDADDVNQICKVFADNRIDYFKAPESLSSMANYGREVPGVIKACDFFVLFISKYSQESPWVIKELECAINNKRHIVPVQISATPLNDRFYFYLSNTEVIKYYENVEAGMDSLLGIIGGCQAEPVEDTEQVKTQEDASDIGQSKDIIRKALNEDEVERKPIVNPFLQESSGIHSRTIEMSNGATRKEDYDSKMHRQLAIRNNMISENQIPVECPECKGDLTKAGDGIFKCVSCGALAYDSFRKVRNYIDQNGATPVTQIANGTGVSRATVEKFLLGERLEIPVWSPITISCVECGASIRTGTHCSACKQKSEFKPTVDRSSANALYRFKRDNK